MAIRYDNKLNNEIKRVVRNYNAKVKRLEHSLRELYLPETTSVSDIKERYTTRKDIKNYLKSLERFSQKGVEETIELKSGLKMSLYEFNELKKEKANIQRNLQRQIKHLEQQEARVGGEKQHVTLAQMGNVRINNLKARYNSISKYSVKDLQNINEVKELKDKIDKNKRRDEYRRGKWHETYTNQVLVNLAYMIKFDTAKLDVITKRINELSDNDFLDLYNTDSLIQRILEAYEQLKNGMIERDTVVSYFDELYNNIDAILNKYKKR